MEDKNITEIKDSEKNNFYNNTNYELEIQGKGILSILNVKIRL